MTDSKERSLVRRRVVVATILLVAAAVPDVGAAQPGSNAAPPDARAGSPNATRAEQERLRSLVQAFNRGVEALDSEALADAVDLASSAQLASVRQSAWQLLQSMALDSALVEPLSEALLTDPDESVRREAAFALAAYRENAGAQRSLANAMRNDSSAEVRLAAQMSTMDSTEQRAFARERLHDRDLMPFERLGPTALLRISSLPPRGPRAPPTIGDAEMADALAIAEVISLTDDPEVKIMGLGELQGMFNSATIRNGRRPSPEVTRVMIDSTRFDNIEVRRSALTALLPLSEDPEVRAALEAAVGNQPELAARLRIPDVLARSSPAGSPPR